MHHAHTGKILEAAIFYVGGETVAMVTAKSITVFLGVNMQDVSTLQDRLAVMLPLDTDLSSVFCVFFLCFGGFLGGKKEADLRSAPELQLTRHITPWEDYAEQTRGGEGTTDWKNDTQSGRQADRRTDGAQLGKDCSPEDTEKQKCKVVVLNLFTWFCCCSALHHI